MGEPVEPHHFPASLFPRFANACPSSFTQNTDKPCFQFRHRAQSCVSVPSIHTVTPLSFPFLSLTLLVPQLKTRPPEKNKKKKVKLCSQKNALTISSRKRFFAKNIVVKENTPIFFAKKYCIAFSFQKGRALSFFSFFLLEIFLRSITFKTRVMLKFKVRTYSVHQQTPKMAIFILNRGKNAGKPLQEPCPNCFIIYCNSADEMETVYWTFYAFWKHGFFHPHLCGSVIEMLRLCDLKTLMRNFIQPALEKSAKNPEMVLKIKATWELETKIRQQAQAVEEFRNALVRRYYLTA